MLSFIMAELREQVAQCQANGSGGGHPQGQPSLELAELLAAVQAAVKAVAATLRSSGLIKWCAAEQCATSRRTLQDHLALARLATGGARAT